MLDLDKRRAILALRTQGHALRTIARDLGVSRRAVRKVLRAGTAEVPRLERLEQAEPWLARIQELHVDCEGNLLRVQEKLADEGKAIAYSTLTAFCRRHGIGVKPKQRKGSYHFGPGEEMQHDTSPHSVVVGGQRSGYQCASVVLCYSRMRYVQLYPSWNRFTCKIFLTEALQFFGGSACHCMVDNSSVVIVGGSGANAVVAPEMDAFGQRFSFAFVAHELGDANRSARVEGPFNHVERNFYPGRQFPDLVSLNEQLVDWCERANHRYVSTLRTRPIDLFVAERSALKPLPLHVPEVYEVHHRLVDLEGFVTVHTNHYSVPEEFLCRRVVVRESKDSIRIFEGHREIAVHGRAEPGKHVRRFHVNHHRPRPLRALRREPPPEERALRRDGSVLAAYVDALQKKHGGRAVRHVRELHRLYIDYPTTIVRDVVAVAQEFGLMNPRRLERMLLRRIAGDFFQLPRIYPEGENE